MDGAILLDQRQQKEEEEEAVPIPVDTEASQYGGWGGLATSNQSRAEKGTENFTLCGKFVAEVFLGWQRVGGIFRMGCSSYYSSDPLPAGKGWKVALGDGEVVGCHPLPRKGPGSQIFDPGPPCWPSLHSHFPLGTRVGCPLPPSRPHPLSPFRMT